MKKQTKLLATTVILASQLVLPTATLATTKVESSQRSKEIQSQELIKNSENLVGASDKQ